MAMDSFHAIADKAHFLQDCSLRFESLLVRAEAAEKNKQPVSIPEFEAFGWNRLEEFLNRFEESVNSPLLEIMRGILENAGVSLDSQKLERLKIGLAVRREGLVEIARQTVQELEKITLTEVLEKAKGNIATYIEEGQWDDLIERVNSWYDLEQQLASIAEAKSKNTILYNALFDLALKEEQSTKLIQRLNELEGLANELGGDLLKQQIRFETPESLTDPLASIETHLRKIAQGKEGIRQLRGEEVALNTLVDKPTKLQEIIDVLEKRRASDEKNFRQKRAIAQDMLDKHNNLAVLLGKNPVSLLDDLDLRNLETFIGESQVSINKLLDELEKSLTPDARVLIENIIESRLPPKWDAQRTFSAIQELLSKGFFFEVKRRED